VISARKGLLSFNINGAFKNPYSTAPVQGYYIQTVDSLGNVIEKSSSFPINVNSWTSMVSASITRADSNNGVNALSKLRLSFIVGMPVPESCKVKIYLPEDMQLTNDLVKVQSTDLSPSDIVPTLSIASNSFYVVGCQSLQADPSHTFTLDLFQILNKGYVSTS
jgi:hypothetical protein